LFKTNNFVEGGKDIVKSLYSSLEKTERGRERERVYCGYSEQAGSPFISVKIYGLVNFLEHLI
jgi:hypothetical protein